MTVLELRDVTKRVRDGRASRVILEHVNLTLDAGTVALVLGPSGSGKTTLLALAGLLSTPTLGEVLVQGEPTSRLRERFRAEARRRQVGFVFQHAELLDDRTAEENVLLPTAPLGIKSADRARARSLLARFGVEALAATPASRLSGGERQRVALCRALFFDPPLLLCDEPTAHLDSTQSDKFVTLLEECAEQQRAVLIATHDERLQSALKSAQRFVLDSATKSLVT